MPINAPPSFWPRVGVSVALLVCLALVVYPRFNRHDRGPIMDHVVGRTSTGEQSMGDAPEYMNAVRYYRGEIPKDHLATPFAYRVGVPYVAARLPVKDPMTALNCVNGVGLALAIFFLHGAMRAIGFGFWTTVMGDFMSILSFPVFYYGAIGLVDPVAVTALAAGLYCLYRRHWLGLCGVIALGALVRETSIVLVVVAASHLLVTRPRNWRVTMVLVALAFILPTLGIRMAFHDLPHYVWKPTLSYLHQNLRLRTVVSIALSFGIPGILTLMWLLQKRSGARASLVSNPAVCVPMFIGILCALGLTAFAFLAAYADGRFLWSITLFGMPFCLDLVGNRPHSLITTVN